MRTFFRLLIVAFAFLGVTTGYAQDTSADTNMQMLRDRLKGDKKALVAANMQLTDAEAKAFWPIYDAYQSDLNKINDRLRNAILAYAKAYNAGPVSNASAEKFVDEAIAIDDAEAKLLRVYAADLAKAVPVTKAARYLQIESKIRAAIRYEMAAAIPLIS
jgi:hypothetical protein